MRFLAAFVAAMFTSTALASIPSEARKHQRNLIREARAVWGLKAPVATFASQIHQESAWRPGAVSRAGAQGLAQFMPRTSEWMSGIYPELGPVNPFDPRWAIRAQVRYMRWLWNRTDGADCLERMAFALSAYNGGLGWVQRRKALSSSPGLCLFVTCAINPGISDANQRENEHYPRRILLELEPRYASWGPGACG